MKFWTIFDEVIEDFKEKEEEIEDIKRIIPQIEGLINNQEFASEDLEYLEDMYEKWRNLNSQIDKITKNVDTISSKQGAAIERLNKFFKDSKQDQLKRCSPITIPNNLKWLNEKIEYWEVLLETMKSKTQAEVNDGPKHLMAINDLQSQVSKWNELIPDLVKRQSEIKIDYDNIKQNVQDLKHSKLDMNKVRNILSLNSSFLEKSNSLITEVEYLINEIKSAESKWKEYEKNEDYQKIIADDLWK